MRLNNSNHNEMCILIETNHQQQQKRERDRESYKFNSLIVSWIVYVTEKISYFETKKTFKAFNSSLLAFLGNTYINIIIISLEN